MMKNHPRVGFDAMFLEQPKTGAGRYAVNLWKQLRTRLDSDNLRLLAPDDAPENVMVQGQGYLTAVGAPPLRGRSRKLWWEQSGLPRAVQATQPALDLVHVPYFAAPAVKSVPYVVTIHDLIPIVVPEYYGSAAMRGYMRLVRRTASSAELILTDSEYSRREILRVLDYPPERVRTIPLAADSQFSPAETDAARNAVDDAIARYEINRPYIVNTGGFDVRKNVPAVVEGFALAQGAIGTGYDLVIIGQAHTRNSRMYPPIDRLIRRLGLTDRVKLVGGVDDADYVALIQGAELFAYASTYEGFGLTPLEAMACGTPLVSSGGTSLSEVIGDAGHIIEPTARGVASGIIAVASDSGLRSELSGRGLEQSRKFSWEVAADQTLDAYRDALSHTVV